MTIQLITDIALIGLNLFLFLHNRKLWKHNQVLATHNATLERQLTVLKNLRG